MGALQADLQKRQTFAEYLATIAHSEGSRIRWTLYSQKIGKLIEKEEKKEAQIAQKEAERASLNAAGNLEGVEVVEAEILDLKEDLRRFRDGQVIEDPLSTGSATNSSFIFDYELDAPITEGSRFTWKDAIVSPASGHVSLPDSQEAIDNISKAAGVLAEVETRLGERIMVVSWYRSEEHNRRIGGASRSHHLLQRISTAETQDAGFCRT